MKLTVLDAIPRNANPRDAFVVHIRVMHGDADGYDTFQVGPFDASTDKEALKSLLRTLKAMDDRYPRGRGGGDEYSYNYVPGFEGWFGTSYANTKEEYEKNCWAKVPYADFAPQRAYAEQVYSKLKNYSDWPSDISMGGGFDLHNEASLDKFSVVYYSDEGVQHNVSVEFD